MEDQEAKSIIESLLFMSGEPVSLNTLRKIIEVDKYNTERLVKELVTEYSTKVSGIFITEIADGYQMVTNPACSPWIKKLLSTSVPKKLTQSSLETMAIIAYKQPIIKAEIEAIRGVNSDGVVKTLLEKRLIKILGRKEVPGRPLMYGTTSEFLQYFGLKDLTELPTLKEFAEVDVPEPPESTPDGMEKLFAVKDEQREVESPEELEGEATRLLSEDANISEETDQAEGGMPVSESEAETEEPFSDHEDDISDTAGGEDVQTSSVTEADESFEEIEEPSETDEFEPSGPETETDELASSDSEVVPESRESVEMQVEESNNDSYHEEDTSSNILNEDNDLGDEDDVHPVVEEEQKTE